MKKDTIFLVIFIVLILFFSFLYLQKNTKKEEKINNPFKESSLYKETNKKRYINYKNNNLNLNIKDIVLRVNIGLDNSFYTNTKEITKFNPLMIINKYNYVNKDFYPDNMVNVDNFAVKGTMLEINCKNNYLNMSKDALKENLNLRIISSYRTYEYQEGLYNNYVKKDGVEKADTYSARPGFSEHHTGLAIDIDNIKKSYTDFMNTKEFNWMLENAHKYGFILRYPEGKENITGYMYEPWHYRYVGEEIATYIKNNNLTYEEYYYEFLDRN